MVTACGALCALSQASPIMRFFVALSAVLATSLLPPQPLTAQSPLRVSEDLLAPMEFRTLGPGFVTGRIADIAIDPNDTNVWYVATAFGGLWKTVNRGVTFEPIFDQDGAAHTTCCVVVLAPCAIRPSRGEPGLR